ncbi:hypothetical protein HAX54_006161 [Datura stramonium]|uniref:Uncharacterized protein n=1 Tax=Datura stramonium TaxID=4076 RepID=A0ABS8WWU5_DATST|nr:hypothetical protein [Datura stramonium]
MAIDMISEAPSLATSPRISFSHDLSYNNSTDTETSSADELFSDGLIRPIQLQEKFVNGSNSAAQQKQSTLQLKQIKNSSAPVSFYTFPSSQKPPLRKNYGAAGL